MPDKHSTIRNGKRLFWYTERLWKLAETLTPFEKPVSSFKELDVNCWFGPEKMPTLREVAEHCQRITGAVMEHPIILNGNGQLTDGGRRLCKALLLGQPTIKAVQFPSMPEQDESHELG